VPLQIVLGPPEKKALVSSTVRDDQTGARELAGFALFGLLK